MSRIKNVLRSFFDPDSFPGQVQRLEAFDSLVKKISQEMERTNQEDKLGVMRSCQSTLHSIPTSALVTLNESFPFEEDGLVLFVRVLSMNGDEDIKVAAHYHPSNLVRTYSAPIILHRLRSSLKVQKLPLHARGSLEYSQMLAVIKIAMAAIEQEQDSRHMGSSRVKSDDPTSDFIPSKLIDLIMAHYDRTDDIIRFMKEKDVTPQQLHPDLLLDYLNADSRPLAEGII